MANKVSVGVEAKGVARASSELDKIKDKFERLQKQGAKGFGIGVGAAATTKAFSLLDTAASSAINAFGDVATAAMEEEKSVSALNASLEANVEGWNGNTDAIEEAIKASEKLAFADDDLRNSLKLLVGATKDPTKALALQATAMDLARFSGKSLVESSEALIAIEGGRYRALGKLIGATGDITNETQALAAVQKVAGGAAKAYGETSAGAYESMQIAMGDVVEEIGTELLPAMKAAAEFMRDDVAPAISDVVKAAKDAGPVFDVLGIIFGGVQTAGTNMSVAAAKMADDILHAQQRADQATEDMREDARRNLTGPGGVTKQFQKVGEVVDETRDSMVDAARDIIDKVFGPLQTRAELYDARSELLASTQEQRDAKTVADKRNATDDIIAALADQGGALIDLGEQGDLTEADVAQFERDVKKHYKDMSKEAVAEVNEIIARLRVLAGFKNIPINVIVSAKNRAKFTEGKLPEFAEGGTVPGPKGAPTLAVVHGGEQVIPNSGLSSPGAGGGTYTINVNLNGGMWTPAAMEQAVGQLRPVIKRVMVESNVIQRGSF